jgi:hypothetical protein
MEFRVTVSLGQDSADPAVLDERAAALQRCIPVGTALVDVVKAAVQLVLPLTADDGLEAVSQGIGIVEQAIRDAALQRPTSIVVIEAEAVTTAVPVENLSPHQPS